jgi:hypothetical protein
MKTTKEKVTSGGCSFRKTSPERNALSPDTKLLNVVIPFDEALRLNLSLHDCLLKLNKIKMNTKEGKEAGVNLAIHFGVKRIQILRA